MSYKNYTHYTFIKQSRFTKGMISRENVVEGNPEIQTNLISYTIILLINNNNLRLHIHGLRTYIDSMKRKSNIIKYQ